MILQPFAFKLRNANFQLRLKLAKRYKDNLKKIKDEAVRQREERRSRVAVTAGGIWDGRSFRAAREARGSSQNAFIGVI